jgi:two-component system nitrogen regulation response regulator NtrX
MMPPETITAVSAPVLLGASPAVRRLHDDIRAAGGASCVLIEAEPGLDATRVAETIHLLSKRPGPFVTLECGAADPDDLERELFGTSNHRSGDLESIDSSSRLALARGGSLYVADLPELSASTQARLARVARDREVHIGDGTVPLDVCLIGAVTPDGDGVTNRLRPDLLRRFSRTRVIVPPLRSRTDDVPAIVQVLVAQLCAERGIPPKTLTQAAMTLLTAMPWRGNLTELQLALARVVSSVSAAVILLEDVLAHVQFDAAMAHHAPSRTLRAARQQFERDYIVRVLQQHGWQIGEAARTLGIQRTNLYRKARQLRIPMTRTGDRSRA